MYFTKIKVTGLTAIDLPLVGALPTDRYILKTADGLGPPVVDVSIGQTADVGGFYQGSRPQDREIVLLIGLNPDYTTGETPADLREELYGMLVYGELPVKVEIMNGATALVETFGYVKNLEIVPFAKDPEVQMTIACIQPYLIAVTDTSVTPSPEDDFSIVNSGQVAAGVRFQLEVDGTATDWALTNETTGQEMSITHDFLNNDKLVVDTRPGSREVTRIRSSVETSVLGDLDSGGVWMELAPGTNNLLVTMSATGVPVGFTWDSFVYTQKFWGI